MAFFGVGQTSSHIMHGRPSAEDPAEGERDDNGDEGKIKSFGCGMGEQDCCDEDERGKIEEQAHGIAERVSSPGLGLDEQKEKEKEEKSLGQSAKFLHDSFNSSALCVEMIIQTEEKGKS